VVESGKVDTVEDTVMPDDNFTAEEFVDFLMGDDMIASKMASVSEPTIHPRTIAETVPLASEDGTVTDEDREEVAGRFPGVGHATSTRRRPFLRPVMGLTVRTEGGWGR
jgi:hypothetical protein